MAAISGVFGKRLNAVLIDPQVLLGTDRKGSCWRRERLGWRGLAGLSDNKDTQGKGDQHSAEQSPGTNYPAFSFNESILLHAFILCERAQ